MTKASINVLFIEDDPGEAYLIKEELGEEIPGTIIRLDWVDHLEKGLERLRRKDVAAVLLDLSLPERESLEPLKRILTNAPNLPVIVIADPTDEKTAIQAVQAGAQDYLLKGQVGGRLLTRSIQYAIRHKKLEAALQESEERFHKVIEATTNAMIITDREGKIKQVNNQAQELFGYTENELVRQPIEILVPGGLRNKHERETKKFITQPLPRAVGLRGNLKGLRKDLEEIPLEIGLVPYESSEGLCILALISDISERKRAEEALRESERQMKALLTSLDDIVFQFDERGTYLNIWTADESLLAYPKAKLLGKRIVEVLGEQNGQLFSDAVRRVIASGRAESIEYPLEVTGNHRWFVARISPILEAGSTYRTASMLIRDITERKGTEEALQKAQAYTESILASIADTYILFDCEWHYLYVNQAAVRAIGRPREQILGRTLWELYPDIVDTELAHQYHRAMDDQISAVFEFHYPSSNTWWENHFYPTPEGLAVFATDITERKQREREQEAVTSVSAALRTAKTLNEMLPRLLDEALSLMEAEAGLIWLYEPITDEIRQVAGRGWAESTQLIFKHGQGITSLVLDQGETITTTDFHTDPRMSQENRDRIPHSVGGACVPLRTAENVVGGMFVYVHLPRQLTAAEVHVLNTLAEIGGNAIHRTRLYERTTKQLEKLGALREIDMAISGSIDLRLSLNIVLKQMIAQLGVDAASILLIRPNSGRLEFAAGRGFRTSNIESSSLRPGQGYAGQAVLDKRIIHIEDLTKTGGLYARRELLASEDFISYFGVPLIAKGEVKGIMEIFHRSKLQVDMEWLNFLDSLGWQTAVAVDNALLFEGMQRSNLDLELAYEATIEGWSKALDLRDKETKGHTQRVTDMTLKLARLLGMKEKQLSHIRRGALLHDIGKMGVPDHILLKPGPLTEDEWKIMRMHPQFAYDLLAPVAYLQQALEIPYYHHEKWDGTGYPHGLKGDLIPLAARIFAVIDVWDAVTSDRPYRPAWPEAKAQEYIHENSGTHFDPQIVKLFLNNLSELRKG